jgi:selenocysteine lyase/cysteine desulfurase
MPRLYIDANASTPPHPDAVAAVQRELALGVAPGELAFCSSATEALHLLLRVWRGKWKRPAAKVGSEMAGNRSGWGPQPLRPVHKVLK